MPKKIPISLDNSDLFLKEEFVYVNQEILGLNNALKSFGVKSLLGRTKRSFVRPSPQSSNDENNHHKSQPQQKIIQRSPAYPLLPVQIESSPPLQNVSQLVLDKSSQTTSYLQSVQPVQTSTNNPEQSVQNPMGFVTTGVPARLQKLRFCMRFVRERLCSGGSIKALFLPDYTTKSSTNLVNILLKKNFYWSYKTKVCMVNKRIRSGVSREFLFVTINLILFGTLAILQRNNYGKGFLFTSTGNAKASLLQRQCKNEIFAKTNQKQPPLTGVFLQKPNVNFQKLLNLLEFEIRPWYVIKPYNSPSNKIVAIRSGSESKLDTVKAKRLFFDSKTNSGQSKIDSSQRFNFIQNVLQPDSTSCKNEVFEGHKDNKIQGFQYYLPFYVGKERIFAESDTMPSKRGTIYYKSGCKTEFREPPMGDINTNYYGGAPVALLQNPDCSQEKIRLPHLKGGAFTVSQSVLKRCFYKYGVSLVLSSKRGSRSLAHKELNKNEFFESQLYENRSDNKTHLYKRSFNFIPDIKAKNISVSGYQFPELEKKQITSLLRKEAAFDFYFAHPYKSVNNQSSLKGLRADKGTLAKIRELRSGERHYERENPRRAERGVVDERYDNFDVTEFDKQSNVLNKKILPEKRAHTPFLQNADFKMQYTQTSLDEMSQSRALFKKLGKDYEDYLRQPKDSLPALIISPSLEDDREIEEEGIRIINKRDFINNQNLKDPVDTSHKNFRSDDAKGSPLQSPERSSSGHSPTTLLSGHTSYPVTSFEHTSYPPTSFEHTSYPSSGLDAPTGVSASTTYTNSSFEKPEPRDTEQDEDRSDEQINNNSFFSTVPSKLDEKELLSAESESDVQDHQDRVANALRQAEEEIESFAKREENAVEKNKQTLPPLTRLESLYAIRNKEEKYEEAKDFTSCKGLQNSTTALSCKSPLEDTNVSKSKAPYRNYIPASPELPSLQTPTGFVQLTGSTKPQEGLLTSASLAKGEEASQYNYVLYKPFVPNPVGFCMSSYATPKLTISPPELRTHQYSKLNSENAIEKIVPVSKKEESVKGSSLPIFEELFLYSDGDKQDGHESSKPSSIVKSWIFSKLGDENICTDRKHSFFGEISLLPKKLIAQEQKQIFQQNADPLLKGKCIDAEFFRGAPKSKYNLKETLKDSACTPFKKRFDGPRTGFVQDGLFEFYLERVNDLKVSGLNQRAFKPDVHSIATTVPLSLLSQLSVHSKANKKKSEVAKFKIGTVNVTGTTFFTSPTLVKPSRNLSGSINRIYFYNNLSQKKAGQGFTGVIKETPLESPISHRIWQAKRMEASTFRFSHRNKSTSVVPIISQEDWSNIMEWQLKKHFFEEDKRLLPLRSALASNKKLKIKKVSLYLPWISIKKVADTVTNQSKPRFSPKSELVEWPLTRLDLIQKEIKLKTQNEVFQSDFSSFRAPAYKNAQFEHRISNYWRLPIQQNFLTSKNYNFLTIFGSRILKEFTNSFTSVWIRIRSGNKANLNAQNEVSHDANSVRGLYSPKKSDKQPRFFKRLRRQSAQKPHYSLRGAFTVHESILFESVTKYSWLSFYTLFFGLIFKQLFKFIYKVGLKEFFIKFLNSDFGRTVTSEEFRHSIQNPPLSEFYMPKKRLRELLGLGRNKAQLLEIVWFLRNNCQGRNGPRGILLVGVPGVENVSVVQAIAGEANVPIIIQSLEKIAVDNEPQTQLEQLYMQAQKKAPCVLFLDKVDTIGARRDQLFTDNRSGRNWDPFSSSAFNNGEQINTNVHKSFTSLNSHTTNFCSGAPESLFENSSNSNNTISNDLFQKNQNGSTLQSSSLNLKKESSTINDSVASSPNKLNIVLRLLTILDGVTQSTGVVTVATAQDLTKLDPALLRPKRFDRRIYLSLPNQQDRIQLFKVQTQSIGYIENMPWDYLTLRTENMSAADIRSAINYSLFRAVLQNSVHTFETLEYGINCVKTLTDKRL